MSGWGGRGGGRLEKEGGVEEVRGKERIAEGERRRERIVNVGERQRRERKGQALFCSYRCVFFFVHFHG